MKRKLKFQETIGGIIFLGLLTATIWSYGSSIFFASNNADGNDYQREEVLNNVKENPEPLKEEKFNLARETLENIQKIKKEYIFINNYSFIQAFTNKDNKVLAYSITTKDKSFNPPIKIIINIYDKDFYIYHLGTEAFVQIEDWLSGTVKFNGGIWNGGYYYAEEYSGGKFKNDQSYIFSYNRNGTDNQCSDCQSAILNDLPEYNKIVETPVILAEEHKKIRERMIPNTITITSPLISYISDFLTFGPSREQVIILDNSEENIIKFSMDDLSKRISLLYPGSNIDFFITNFGQPSFINEINIQSKINE